MQRRMRRQYTHAGVDQETRLRAQEGDRLTVNGWLKLKTASGDTCTSNAPRPLNDRVASRRRNEAPAAGSSDSVHFCRVDGAHKDAQNRTGKGREAEPVL